jgi:hypothetical protein
MAKDNTTGGQNSPRPRRRAPGTTAKGKERSSAVAVPSPSEVNDRGNAAVPVPPATAGRNMGLMGAEVARKRPARDEVARRAFEIYSRRGTHGRDLEDWLEAEKELGGGKTN